MAITPLMMKQLSSSQSPATADTLKLRACTPLFNNLTTSMCLLSQPPVPFVLFGPLFHLAITVISAPVICSDMSVHI